MGNSVGFVAAGVAMSPTPVPLGKLYDIGGRNMHLNCTGTGSPAVILEAGAGAFALDWALVQPTVSTHTRVCSYDRAGHAWSDLGPLPRTGLQAVHDLRRLLTVAHEKGPFVFVGHSMGGILVRLYAMRYPDDVAGMVLLDPGVENGLVFVDGRWTREFFDAKPRQIPAPRETIADSERVLSRAELDGAQQFWKMFGAPAIDGPYEKLPAALQQTRLWAMSQPSAVTTDFDPYLGEEVTLLLAQRIATAHPLGDKPLVVIGKTPEQVPANAAPNSGQALRITERPEQLRRLGELSTNSVVMTAVASRHEIHLDQPDLVADAITKVVAAARRHEKVAVPLDGRATPLVANAAPQTARGRARWPIR